MDDLDLVNPDHVREHTPPRINEALDREARARVAELSAAGARRRRLRELDVEWSVDRAVMLNFAIVGGLAFSRGVRARGRRRWNGWLTFFSIQLGFLAFHAVRGWCPPVAVFRRLGYRTAREIEAERHAVANTATVA